MKKLKLLVVLAAIFAAQPTHAQLLKKLKQKVERSVENTITNKVADKAAREAGKSMDKILDPKFGEDSPVPMGASRGDMSKVPDTYDFEWAYKLRMEPERSKDQMDIEYYLKEDAPYWGARFDNKQMQEGMDLFMVYDMGTEQTVMFMDSGDMKMATATSLDSDVVQDAANQTDMDDYTMEKIGGKTVLGYDCDGFVVENQDHKIIMYITFDAEVSFSDIHGKNQKMPENFDPNWLRDGDKEGLMMEMDFTDKKKKKNNMKMTCVKLEKQPFSISKGDYQSY